MRFISNAKYYKFNRWVYLTFRALKTGHIKRNFGRKKMQLGCQDKLVTYVLKMLPDFAMICLRMAQDFVMLHHWWSFFIFPRNLRTLPCQQISNQARLNDTTRRTSLWVGKRKASSGHSLPPPPLFPPRRSKGKQAEKCTNGSLYLIY